MPKKTKVAESKARRTKPTHIDMVPARRVVKTRVARPVVDEVITTTEVETVPTVEIRKPATLAQALTEPAQIVEKTEPKVVSRTVRKRRVA
jgi:hypothetical protein